MSTARENNSNARQTPLLRMSKLQNNVDKFPFHFGSIAEDKGKIGDGEQGGGRDLTGISVTATNLQRNSATVRSVLTEQGRLRCYEVHGTKLQRCAHEHPAFYALTLSISLEFSRLILRHYMADWLAVSG